jgi:hypothetical protein
VVPSGFAGYVRIANDSLRNGLLEHRGATALAGILSNFTARTDTCWFCLWDGYGYLHPGGMAWMVAARPPFARLQRAFRRLQLSWSRPKPSKFRNQARVRLPNRDYLLFSGAVSDAPGWDDGPNLWWPDDRAWCVASEIDLDDTFVGGPGPLIAELLALSELRAVPTSETEPLVSKQIG